MILVHEILFITVIKLLKALSNSASDKDVISFVLTWSITNGTATNSGCVSILLVRRRTLIPGNGCTRACLILSTYLAMESDRICTLTGSNKREKNEYPSCTSLKIPSKILNLSLQDKSK